MTLRNSWARSLFEFFTRLVLLGVSPLHDLNISCFLDPASLFTPTHTCMHTFPAKATVATLFFSFVLLSTCAYYLFDDQRVPSSLARFFS